MIEVAMMIPTRSRQDRFVRAARSAIASTTNAAVVGYIDNDQEFMYPDALTLAGTVARVKMPGITTFAIEKHPDAELPRLAIMVGPRVGPLGSVNWLSHSLTDPDSNFLAAVGPVRALAYMTDDSTVGPFGWDQWLLKTIDAFPKRLGVISCHYADDDTTNVNFPAMSVEMYQALGWFGPPEMHAWYWDTALEIIADVVGITYSHGHEMHFTHDCLPNEPGKVLTTEDAIAFHFWCLTKRKQAIRRLKEAVAAC